MKALILLCILCFSPLYPEELSTPKEEIDIEIIKNAIQKKSDRLFFYTSPRSGTHWTRYILRYMTQRLILIPGEPLYVSDYLNGLDLSKPYIYSSHITSKYHYLSKNEEIKIIPPNFKKDKILIVVRNPLESFIRCNGIHDGLSTEEIITRLKNTKQCGLFRILSHFETWPAENKLLIFYENLLSNPEAEITKLLNFLGEPLDDLPDFLSHIEEHIDRSIEAYKPYGESYSKGKDMLYHSKKLTPQERKQIFDALKRQNPTLFEKYLSWYKDLCK